VGQDKKSLLRREVVRLLEAGVSGQVFPGASACVGWRDGGALHDVVAVAGRLAPDGPPVEARTFYDLASVTKPFVAMAALRMVADGVISLDSRADALVPDVRGGVGVTATLDALLSHRSGLAAWGGFYLDVPHEPGTAAARRWILNEAARRKAEGAQGGVVYSDLGYMLAGEMLARAAGMPLDAVVGRYVTEPLGIDSEVFFAGALSTEARAHLSRRVAPTERCEWRGRLVQGEVHDENCAALGGVAGHAGLFGTARAVTTFGRTMLEVLGGRSDFLPGNALQRALADRDGDSHRLGWDTKSEDGSAAGRRMSLKSFGHLGFTGTSLWCDPVRDAVIVLLTNRVYPSRANWKIKGFRPAFHDGVLATFDG
jgi:serine-type D-Ala-D-Ala carboxypeptidase